MPRQKRAGQLPDSHAACIYSPQPTTSLAPPPQAGTTLNMTLGTPAYYYRSTIRIRPTWATGVTPFFLSFRTRVNGDAALGDAYGNRVGVCSLFVLFSLAEAGCTPRCSTSPLLRPWGRLLSRFLRRRRPWCPKGGAGGSRLSARPHVRPAGAPTAARIACTPLPPPPPPPQVHIHQASTGSSTDSSLTTWRWSLVRECLQAWRCARPPPAACAQRDRAVATPRRAPCAPGDERQPAQQRPPPPRQV